jgi:hypothetical protein
MSFLSRLPLNPKMNYSLRSKDKSSEGVSQGGLALDPVQANPVGHKSLLLKAQQKVILDISKGKQKTIMRALGVGNSLKRHSP